MKTHTPHTRNNNIWYDMDEGQLCADPPSWLLPTTVYFHHDASYPTYFQSKSSQHAFSPRILTAVDNIWNAGIPDFLHGTHPFYQRLLGPVQRYQHAQISQIGDDILSGQLIVCSDGSYFQQQGTGTFAWVVGNKGNTVWIKAAGLVDYHPRLNSAYRAELCGLLAVIYFLQSGRIFRIARRLSRCLL